MLRYLTALRNRNRRKTTCPECLDKYWDMDAHWKFDHADLWRTS